VFITTVALLAGRAPVFVSLSRTAAATALCLQEEEEEPQQLPVKNCRLAAATLLTL
jgi:hypothetical protein